MSDDASPARFGWWIAAGIAAVVAGSWAFYGRGEVAPVAAPSPQKVTISPAELENLRSERHRLVSELERVPAISATGLASPEAIAANEGRFVALVVVLDRLGQGAAPTSGDLGAATRERSRLEREVYAKSGELLEFLRGSFGQWKFEEGPGLQVHFDAQHEDGQGRLKELGDRLRMAQAALDRADDNVRALTPVAR